MKKMFLITKRKITEKQKEDAKIYWGVEQFINLPEDLKEDFLKFKPGLSVNEVNNLARRIVNWLYKNSDYYEHNLVLLEGENNLVVAIILYHYDSFLYCLTPNNTELEFQKEINEISVDLKFVYYVEKNKQNKIINNSENKNLNHSNIIQYFDAYLIK